MNAFKISVVFLVLFSFVYTVNSNVISSLFKKRSVAEDDYKDDESREIYKYVFVSDEDNSEVEDKKAAKAAEGTIITTTAATTTTTAANPCGGLKGFLHLCEKSDPTEPPKNIKTRSVLDDDESRESDEDDDDDDDDDNDSDEDSDEVKQETAIKEENSEIEESNATSESTVKEGTIEKRQSEEPEAPKNFFELKKPEIEKPENSEESDSDKPEDTKESILSPDIFPDAILRKRQTEEKNTSEEPEITETIGEADRRKRDCTDRYENYDKDCKRKKRELVPCVEPKCKKQENMNVTE